MTESLLSRLDAYVIGLLDEAEGHCEQRPSNDTTAAEDAPALRKAVSLSERIALLKATTAYIELRNKMKPDDVPPAQAEERGDPEIVRFQSDLKRRERGRR